jgi:photosystem II stability/assembly factor-like uncharacterized protein
LRPILHKRSTHATQSVISRNDMRHVSNVIFLCVLIPIAGLAQSRWTKKTTSTLNPLIAVKFSTPTDGWAVGSRGTILHTTDGGESWKADSVEYMGVKSLLSFVEPRDSLNIWAGCWSAPTFRSRDGGLTWTSQWIDSIANISKVFFVNPSLAFAAGTELSEDYSGRILKSTDGGESWEAIYDMPHRGFGDIFFVDSLFGVAVGAKTPVFDNFDQGTIFRTTAGGVSWTEIDAPGSGPLSHVSFFDKNIGWACGDNAHLLSTTDGGIIWSQKFLSLGGNSPLFSVATPAPSEVWVTPSFSDKLYHSTDNGQTWTTDQFPVGTGLFGLFFSNTYHGWAVGNSGNIWKYDVPTSVSNIAGSTSPSLFRLGNYPNPFNPSTSIVFSLPTASFATVRVIDMNGRQLATLLDKYLPTGEYEVTFNGEYFPSGVYFYILSTKTHFSSGKMILSK